MADDVVHYCGEPPVFPKPILNRPGLMRVGYRVGNYADFLDAMLRQINASTPLQSWTHRAPDDPGIALVQCAAIVGDILTFYQEHYANEAFLRTAAWRESVSDLVRLLGYRLAPGVGGCGTFAFDVKGTEAITVPIDFPIKAELDGIDEPVYFRTEAELIAYPHLGRFNLYRPRAYATTVAAQTRSLELESADGEFNPDTLAAVGLKEGDRILLMPGESMWSVSGTAFSTQQTAQMITVSKVTQVLDRVIVEFEGGLQESWTTSMKAYRLGRTFKHFGHNAPLKYTRSKKTGSEVTGAYEYDTKFLRGLDHACSEHDIYQYGTYLTLNKNALPLDQEVNDLSLRTRLIIQSIVRLNGIAGSDRRGMTVVRQIVALTPATLSCGSLNGPSTLVGLDENIIKNSNGISDPFVDVRDVRVLEVTSPELTFRNVAGPLSESFFGSTDALCFYGTYAQALALSSRRLFLQHEDGRTADLVCTTPTSDFTEPAEDYSRLWPLDFDRLLSSFTPGDFDEEEATTTVYGNLADMTQGKAEQEATLGNGDGRLAFQTFKLPKAPLTYLTSASATPPQVPELEVYVNRRKWTRVESFFGRGPAEEIYIVREDADENSYVQFGDGETGARLPSGLKNVIARYRSGAGAFGPAKTGTSPSASQKLDGLHKLYLPGLISGGQNPRTRTKHAKQRPRKCRAWAGS